MKGLLFFGLLLVVLLVASFALAKEQTKPVREGYVNPGSDQSLLAPAVVVPDVNPKPSVLEGTSPAPYTPPIEKEYGPALGEIARVNTLPYKDPALEAAPYARLAELKESLQAFFTFEAKSLEKMSDPEVQLPLTTARGDLSRLTDEISVLKRNPGIGSALTQGQADDIQANLTYLQRKYRLSVNSASGSELLEGFESLVDKDDDEGFEDKQDDEEAFEDKQDDEEAFEDKQDDEEAFEDKQDDEEPFKDMEDEEAFKDKKNAKVLKYKKQAKVTKKSDTLSLKELKNLKITILAEITRLSASGTTDPVITARVNTLNSIKNNINTIITEVENKTRLESQIPIMKNDVKKFLPAMSDPSKALPQLMNSSGLPATAANIFPAYGAGDKTGAMMAQNLFERYGEAVFNGLSWNVGLDYTSPRSVALAASKAQQNNRPAKAGVQMNASLGDTRYPPSKMVAFPRGEMESVTAGSDVSRLERNPSSAVSTAAKFDWRQKSADICSSIKRRGLNPADFGCVSTSTRMGADYSWRGNARMVCTRLLTTPDPGLPQTCGCPPINWPGWRS